jgi:hypothetical protein
MGDGYRWCSPGGASDERISSLPGRTGNQRVTAQHQNSAKKPPMAAGEGVTRHPGAGAAEQRLG